MTAALKGGEWSAARPGRTLPLGKKRYPLYRRLGGPHGRSGRAENLVSTGILSRIVQPVVSRYTDWTTRSNIYIYIYICVCVCVCVCVVIWDSVVSVATRIYAGRSIVRIPAGTTRVSLFPNILTGCGALFSGCRGSSQGWSGWIVILTTRLYLAPRLKMNRYIRYLCSTYRSMPSWGWLV